MVRLRSLNGSFPWGPVSQEFNRVVNDLLHQGWNWSPTGENAPYPAVNVWERDAEFVAEAELPGVRLEDLDVSVVGNELTIKGRRVDSADEGTTYHRRERGTGDFTRVLRLPVDVDADKVSAKLVQGVLTISLPKAVDTMPRKVMVSGG